MASNEEAESELPVRQRQPKQQLSRAMEHMRTYVAIPDAPLTTSPSIGEDAYGVPATFEPVRKPATASKENAQKRSDPFQFGTRYLEEGDDIFTHNAWDHVEVDPQYNAFIEQQTVFQRENQVSDFDKQRFSEKPEKWWDRFYSNNRANFFKDRKWLVQEFPFLGQVTCRDHGPATLLEVGAGAGNTAFPILAMNENPALRLHACDYSKKAIEIIRSQPAYTEQNSGGGGGGGGGCGGGSTGAVLQADVWDVAGAALPPGLVAGSVDVVLMIFVFSALSPDQWAQAVRNIYILLKPGGEVFFRDYGRGDLAQVRFKKDRYLDENFYVRGDGTRVYFFDEHELRNIWAPSSPPSPPSPLLPLPPLPPQDPAAAAVTVAKREPDPRGEGAVDGESDPPRFDILALAVDRRMLVNRQRKLKMYRCWLQGRFTKPTTDTTT